MRNFLLSQVKDAKTGLKMYHKPKKAAIYMLIVPLVTNRIYSTPCQDLGKGDIITFLLYSYHKSTLPKA